MGAGPAAEPGRRAVPRGFADDAAQDAVILSVQDIRAAQEAIALARADREAGRDPAGPEQPLGPPDEPLGPPDQPAGAASPGPGRPLEAGGSGGSPPGEQSGGPPPRANTTPSWGAVLATTIRLWWQRRVRPRTASPRWRVISVVVLAGVLLAAAALGLALTRGGGRTTDSASPGAGGPGAGSQAASTAALKAAAAARTAAAAWLVQQVASAAIVACDPQMCAVLQQAGLPAGRLLVLGTGTAGPLSSDVLVATAAVRQEFGTRLASVYAPAVLARFGAGSAQVAIRVVAPDGAAAYITSLRADQAARLSAGKQLLRNPRIHASAGALPALANGQVDARLLTVFAALATLHSVRVLGFAPQQAGGSPGLPLRTTYLAPDGPGTAKRPNSVPSLASFLRAQLAPYRPARITDFRLPGGGSALRVEFAAPSPLGLLGKS
jgi:hypothetical protein